MGWLCIAGMVSLAVNAVQLIFIIGLVWCASNRDLADFGEL